MTRTAALMLVPATVLMVLTGIGTIAADTPATPSPVLAGDGFGWGAPNHFESQLQH
ncbi:hypothetical protein [Streptomyces sp. G-G2]|uniref:hypothetical protein n=1 Tax=Streptomyces sp. G-G2 TaxID=3046201 RepID=UPI0024BBC140|nr:hypothetical protein [Streptomyces sp. G-G2]MDJ0386273.1 hypothetical protein [Streptomyces sp. G-G2]